MPGMANVERESRRWTGDGVCDVWCPSSGTRGTRGESATISLLVLPNTYLIN